MLRAKYVARGRCRNIVRVPWDVLLSAARPAVCPRPQTALNPQTKIPYTVGRARSIVHFDPLVAAARNRPTAVAITGEPGGGKTTLAMLLIYQPALRGATVAVIDPKGDAESLVEYLRRQGRKARVLPLNSAAPGLLDPFSFGMDLSEKRTMATETLRLLLPRMSEERESAMIQAVGAVAGTERPSLGKVVKHLEEAEDPAWKNTGAVMRAVSEMRLARLCFAPSVGQQIDAEGWTTVFTLAGLTLPDTNTSRDDYSYEQRLSVALLYLVSQFARKLLNGIDRAAPKAIFLDEAWAITSTPEGAKLVPEVSRMGRSRNTALILVSQNAGDLLNEQVTNSLSGEIAFRSTERGEVANAIYFHCLVRVAILGAIWLAWQGLIRKRATRTIEGTLWMVVAFVAAIALIGRPAAFTGVGTTGSNGVTQVLNTALSKLPAPASSNCLPVQQGDPQAVTGDFAYTSGNALVDENANELWSVLVCKPWLYGERGTTQYATNANGPQTVVNKYGRQLLWAQAIKADSLYWPVASLVGARQAVSGFALSVVGERCSWTRPVHAHLFHHAHAVGKTNPAPGPGQATCAPGMQQILSAMTAPTYVILEPVTK